MLLGGFVLADLDQPLEVLIGEGRGGRGSLNPNEFCLSGPAAIAAIAALPAASSAVRLILLPSPGSLARSPVAPTAKVLMGRA